MCRAVAVSVPAAALTVSGTAAAADPLGDRIAEHLCYPPSARESVLSEADRTRYRTAMPVTGSYRDIQGADARAWFEKTGDGAECRTPATTSFTLFFCAPVRLEGDRLIRGDRRLCD